MGMCIRSMNVLMVGLFCVSSAQGEVTFFESSDDVLFASASNPQTVVTFEEFGEGAVAQCQVDPGDPHPACSFTTQGVTITSTAINDALGAISLSISTGLGVSFPSQNLISSSPADTEPDKVTGRVGEFYMTFGTEPVTAIGFETNSGSGTINGNAPTILVTIEEDNGAVSSNIFPGTGLNNFVGAVSDVGISRIFLADNTPNGSSNFGIDNLQITSVPEPTSLLVVTVCGLLACHQDRIN